MEWYLIILGLICIGLGFLTEHPRFRERITQPWIERQWTREEAMIKQTRQEAEKAREDVAVLLAELDRASDKIVDLMTGWADKVQNQDTEAKLAQEPMEEIKSPKTITKESKTKEIKPKEIKPKEVKPKEVKPKEVKPKETKSKEIKTKELRNKELKTKSVPVQASPIQVLPAKSTGKTVPIEAAKRNRNENFGTSLGKRNQGLKDKYKSVLHLAEQGLSIGDIAQSAKIGKGEVQLLLDLQNRGDK